MPLVLPLPTNCGVTTDNLVLIGLPFQYISVICTLDASAEALYPPLNCISRIDMPMLPTSHPTTEHASRPHLSFSCSQLQVDAHR